jgi:non-ribosomal peptide synthetase component F
MQGAWALLLSHYSQQRDVVFGVTVTDRPASLPDVENMIGLFINTLPLRVTVAPDQALNEWLEEIQNRHAEQQQYQYVSLAQVQAWSEVTPDQPLFNNFLRFQNYSPGGSCWKPEELGSVQIQTVRDIDWWHYPLGVVIAPGIELKLRFAYNEQLFSAETIIQLLLQFQAVLEKFLLDPAQPIGMLLNHL